MHGAKPAEQYMVDLLVRKESHFVLWRPYITDPAPKLLIGKFQGGHLPVLKDEQSFVLAPSEQGSDLWEIAAQDCHLNEGEVYHYWLEVTDTNPYKSSHPRVYCTDPTAWAVDWRLLSPPVSAPSFGEEDRYPASVVLYQQGKLVPCDPDGQQVDWKNDPSLDLLPANNQLVIYELPASWARKGKEGTTEIGRGSFRDVMALIEPETSPANFAGITAFEKGHAHLRELGINALELLPPTDSFVKEGWGYAPSNYFAADFDLGLPGGAQSPTASCDLVHLIKTCHQNGMRFFDDVVMAFAARNSYRTINFPDFFVQSGVGDPEEIADGKKRDGFGGDLFKYNYWVETYDPITGEQTKLVPARALMLLYLKHWMHYYRLDGLRVDSVANIANWDFIKAFTDEARCTWQMRWQEQGHGPAGADERFLMVGEELAVPLDLVRQHRLDSLWNDHFKRILRAVILGKNVADEQSFEGSVRKLIDCRLLGFQDGSQAINYVTSHDVEGFGHERLYSFLINTGVIEAEQRIKLAFVCLLTAVGIPMIFAGEEFGDQHDLQIQGPEKQLDPVNFERRDDPWRLRIFEYVTKLVKLRCEHAALRVNDTDFIHLDFHEGKRVLVWQRGQRENGDVVVVIANFSAYGTPDPLSENAEYVVTNWPALPQGKRWYEVTQDREVPTEWAGREPIFPWEAKVYAAVASAE